MESPVTSPVSPAVVLHPADDVAVALRPLEPGPIALRSGDAKTFEVRAAIPMGHKFALRDIPVGAVLLPAVVNLFVVQQPGQPVKVAQIDDTAVVRALLWILAIELNHRLS